MKLDHKMICTFALGIGLAATASAKTYKMTTDTPENRTTPDKVETLIGTLNFFDGVRASLNS